MNKRSGEYLITIENDENGKWSFRYAGKLSWLKKWMLGVCGFEVKEIAPPPTAEEKALAAAMRDLRNAPWEKA